MICSLSMFLNSTLLERVYCALTRGGEAGIWDFEEGNVTCKNREMKRPTDLSAHWFVRRGYSSEGAPPLAGIRRSSRQAAE